MNSYSVFWHEDLCLAGVNKPAVIMNDFNIWSIW